MRYVSWQDQKIEKPPPKSSFCIIEILYYWQFPLQIGKPLPIRIQNFNAVIVCRVQFVVVIPKMIRPVLDFNKFLYIWHCDIETPLYIHACYIDGFRHIHHYPYVFRIILRATRIHIIVYCTALLNPRIFNYALYIPRHECFSCNISCIYIYIYYIIIFFILPVLPARPYLHYVYLNRSHPNVDYVPVALCVPRSQGIRSSCFLFLFFFPFMFSVHTGFIADVYRFYLYRCNIYYLTFQNWSEVAQETRFLVQTTSIKYRISFKHAVYSVNGSN
jgi:hypothetical protein